MAVNGHSEIDSNGRTDSDVTEQDEYNTDEYIRSVVSAQFSFLRLLASEVVLAVQQERLAKSLPQSSSPFAGEE